MNLFFLTIRISVWTRDQDDHDMLWDRMSFVCRSVILVWRDLSNDAIKRKRSLNRVAESDVRARMQRQCWRTHLWKSASRWMTQSLLWKRVCLSSLELRSWIEFDAVDADFVHRWHLSKLDTKTRALIQIGKNAAALVASYPATAPERTTLRQQLCQGMRFLLCSLLNN
jgi:hypothetical protein